MRGWNALYFHVQIEGDSLTLKGGVWSLDGKDEIIGELTTKLPGLEDANSLSIAQQSLPSNEGNNGYDLTASYEAVNVNNQHSSPVSHKKNICELVTNEINENTGKLNGSNSVSPDKEMNGIKAPEHSIGLASVGGEDDPSQGLHKRGVDGSPDEPLTKRLRANDQATAKSDDLPASLSGNLCHHIHEIFVGNDKYRNVDLRK